MAVNKDLKLKLSWLKKLRSKTKVNVNLVSKTRKGDKKGNKKIYN